MGEFRMPSLGADMEDGTLVEWTKKPGDRIKRGDIVAVIETQKGAIEVDVFEEGILDRIFVEVGTTVPVGTPLAMIATDGESHVSAASPPPAVTKKIEKPQAPAAAAPAEAPPIRPPQCRERLPVSPAARRLARDRGISLGSIHGTGPHGAIIYRDVEHAEAGAPAPARRRGFDFAEMRRAIAAAMARSKREIPHYYLSTTIDVTRALEWIERVNKDRPPQKRLLFIAVLLKAVTNALGEMPEFNGFYTERGFQPLNDINLGVAIALRGGGLIAPAIRGAAELGIDDMMTRVRDLIGRARSGGLRSSELSLATITVTSLGERGIETVFGAIYPPQVALVGFGTPVERPWVVGGAIVPRRLVIASLSADHRASDGHRGALFLSEIDKRLQEPEVL